MFQLQTAWSTPDDNDLFHHCLVHKATQVFILLMKATLGRFSFQNKIMVICLYLLLCLCFKKKRWYYFVKIWSYYLVKLLRQYLSVQLRLIMVLMLSLTDTKQVQYFQILTPTREGFNYRCRRTLLGTFLQ